MKNITENYTICLDCKGEGKKSRKFKKKTELSFKKQLEEFEKAKAKNNSSTPPNLHLITCETCSGSGLIKSSKPTLSDNKNYPHIAIIGGGIGGVALAVACLHRGIPFTLYERDSSFNVRAQGYGLTLQQASKEIKGLGISSLKEGVNSTRHVVHNTNGKIIGEWGMRNNIYASSKKSPKRTNIHIARQALRQALLNQLKGDNQIQWNHKLVNLKETKDKSIELTFKVNDEFKYTKADLVVGADGIRSTVRKLTIGDRVSPLRYLNCIVILGICKLSALEDVESELLDSATVFQTANGNERIYIMPFSKDSVMWQLSFPMTENDAKSLSKKGSKSLKEEAVKKTQWHYPIPQIIAATLETQISGYPVYDRALLSSELLEKNDYTTLIGDAAHPMSPFKGQGANQALLDALSLARKISKECSLESNWKSKGIRKSVLTEFEEQMLIRSAKKVKDSASAAKFLHSEIILQEGNRPRGRSIKE